MIQISMIFLLWPPAKETITLAKKTKLAFLGKFLPYAIWQLYYCQGREGGIDDEDLLTDQEIFKLFLFIFCVVIFLEDLIFFGGL